MFWLVEGKQFYENGSTIDDGVEKTIILFIWLYQSEYL